MLKKYTIEYSLSFRRHSPPEHHQYFTDDPVACEEFIQELLERGLGLHAIKHEGADLPRPDFDRIVKLAASRAAARMLCVSLHLKPEEEHYRFGFVA